MQKRTQKTQKREQFHPFFPKTHKKTAKKSKTHPFPNLGKFHLNSCTLNALRCFFIPVPEKPGVQTPPQNPILSSKTSIPSLERSEIPIFYRGTPIFSSKTNIPNPAKSTQPMQKSEIRRKISQIPIPSGFNHQYRRSRFIGNQLSSPHHQSHLRILSAAKSRFIGNLQFILHLTCSAL